MQKEPRFVGAEFLCPADEWIELARDNEQSIWITKLSYRLIQSFDAATVSLRGGDFQSVAQYLQVNDYACFALVAPDRVVIECRPRSWDRIYVDRTSDTRIAAYSGIDRLPKSPASYLPSREFLDVWLANALYGGLNDHFLGKSPFCNVDLILRGVRGSYTFHSSTVTLIPAMGGVCDQRLSIQQAGEACKVAMREYISRVSANRAILLECSGGIDSGITAAAAKLSDVSRQVEFGMFSDFPYREFRFERGFAEAVSAHVQIPLKVVDYRLWSIWGAEHCRAIDKPSNEPSLEIPFWGQAVALRSAAKGMGPSIALNGQAGDLLFATQPPTQHHVPRPSWISRERWGGVLATSDAVSFWSLEADRIADGYSLDNPWMARQLAGDDFEFLYLCPLASRTVVNSIQQLQAAYRSSIADRHEVSHIQKPVAYAAFAEWLPEKVWHRRWKIDFVGTYYRHWLRNAQSLTELVQSSFHLLKTLELDVKELVDSTARACGGRDCLDRPLNALVAYLFWYRRLIHGHQEQLGVDVLGR